MDLKGIIEKLDYIKYIGIDGIWLSPVNKSPNHDNGYDVKDYLDIMEDFGNMADFKELVYRTHKREIKVIMDLVANHTSDEHEWFVKAKSSKLNPYKDYYFFKKGRDKGKLPNNWEFWFGGST